jgi:uncharacterized FlaG/YvyC family protein
VSKELKFEFNDYIIAIDEPYENDCGYVAIGKKDTKDNINIWFKSLNQQTVDFYIELQKHIADLEAKLAESEEEIRIVREQNGRVIEKLDLIVRSNQGLEQQLAEKEKEAQEIYEMYNQERKKNWLYNRKNQDKIAFAVEQLEKVKEHISSGLAFDIDVQMWFEEYIDNQIAELKKENVNDKEKS